MYVYVNIFWYFLESQVKNALAPSVWVSLWVFERLQGLHSSRQDTPQPSPSTFPAGRSGATRYLWECPRQCHKECFHGLVWEGRRSLRFSLGLPVSLLSAPKNWLPILGHTHIIISYAISYDWLVLYIYMPWDPPCVSFWQTSKIHYQPCQLYHALASLGSCKDNNPSVGQVINCHHCW